MLCCCGLRGWSGVIFLRDVEALSRSQMILIKTFSPSRGQGLSKIAQFDFAVFAGCFNAVQRDSALSRKSLSREKPGLRPRATTPSASSDGRVLARSLHIADGRTRDRSLPLAGY